MHDSGSRLFFPSYWSAFSTRFSVVKTGTLTVDCDWFLATQPIIGHTRDGLLSELL